MAAGDLKSQHCRRSLLPLQYEGEWLDDVMTLTPLINVEDASRSIKFYAENFGFEVERQFEMDGKVTWARLSRGAIGIMINVSQERAVRGNRSEPQTYDDVVLYFEVDSAQEIHDGLLRKGFSPAPSNGRITALTNSLCAIPMATNWHLRVDSSRER